MNLYAYLPKWGCDTFAINDHHLVILYQFRHLYADAELPRPGLIYRLEAIY